MKKIYKDSELPVYEIYIDDEDSTGIRFVSLVDDPAIQLKGMFFSGIKSYDFKAQKDKQIIVGPAMIPNKKILRKDEDGNKYYVVFTKDTILQMVSKFNSSGTNRRINIDHSKKMVNAYIMENWIVEDEYYDKSRKYGFEVPVGTWMVSIKVEDEKFWNDEVKEGGKYGFSIEGIMGQKPMSYSMKEFDFNDLIDSLTDKEVLQMINDIEDEKIIEYFRTHGTELNEGEEYMDFADDDDDFLPSQRVYVWSLKPGVEGPFIKENSRPFCRFMRDINRYWKEEEVNDLSASLGYDFWKYFGSYNCRHTLKPVILTKNTNPAKSSDISTGVEKQAEAGLLGFSEEFQETYDDYPREARENAKTALRWAEKNGWGSCGTPVGKARANQLAKGEPISRDTIARMSAFKRHKQNSQGELGDGCGRLMWLAWGGDAGIEWATRKLQKIERMSEEEFVMEPKSDETEREFLSRCIPFEINEGYDQSQAIAICYSKWDKK